MKTLTKALAKGTFATVAAGAMALSAASPAAAQDRYRDHDRDDGISAGEIIAGAVVLGGIAAIIASADNDDRYDRNDRRYRDRNYRGNYNGYDGYGRNASRRAIQQCVAAAERTAQRYTGSRAEVYEIRDVDRERRGYEIEGRIAVRDGYRDRRDYRRGYRNDGWREGRFECEYRNGRVVDVDFSGIRGL
ncbi:MAG: hypothetical protein JY451_11865 [Erythrobacter sp.]|nr:MAG: hypothetical protein JY451_11865 [Erythrobacter sp.]